jgi:hypothetical protein
MALFSLAGVVRKVVEAFQPTADQRKAVSVEVMGLISERRGDVFDPILDGAITVQQDLSGDGDQGEPIAFAGDVLVIVSGTGAVTARLLVHPGLDDWAGDLTAPAANSPHWTDAAPQEPITGTLAAGEGLAAAYSGPGASWWKCVLEDGGAVAVFFTGRKVS